MCHQWFGLRQPLALSLSLSLSLMAGVAEPVIEEKDQPSPPKPVPVTWSNKKEDYELKDVIGLCEVPCHVMIM